MTTASWTALRLFAAVLFVSGLSVWAFAAPDDLPTFGSGVTPWALRDHLTFTSEEAAFLCDVQTAEWRVETQGSVPVVDLVGFEVVLGDGTTLTGLDLEKATLEREPFTSGADKGTAFGVVFPPKDGLAIRYEVTSYSTEPFLRIRLSVQNVGTAPVDIAALRPIVMGPGVMTALSPNAVVRDWPMVMRGPTAVFSKESASLFSMIHDPARRVCLAVGVLPQGVASSGAVFERFGESWQGTVSSRFEPAVRLASGATLEADPVWVSHGMSTPERVSLYFAWACRNRPGMPSVPPAPDRWVSVEPGDSVNDLLAMAVLWNPLGVRHVLVPRTWEGRPGSLQGAVPRYPKNMKAVADEIRAISMVPGLTLDPLLIDAKEASWTALSVDGRRWLNVSSPEARQYGADRVRRVLDWGYGFLAVEPSEIPDEVLRHFGLTRSQADHLALQMVVDAAGDVPVVPTAATTLRGDPGAWLEAAGCTSTMAANQVSMGPIRLDVEGLDAVEGSLAIAMRFLGSPIEVLGKPARATRDPLARLFAMSRLSASPTGPAAQRPLLWHVWVFATQDAARQDVVVMLPGAPAWRVTDLNLDGNGPARVWRATDGAFVDSSNTPIPPAAGVTVYGLACESSHPVLMGASSGVALLLDDVAHLNWTEADPGSGVLSGRFEGRHTEDATAYVAIPAGWSFDSGKAGETSISRRAAGDRVSFAVPTGRPTRFELKFKRP